MNTTATYNKNNTWHLSALAVKKKEEHIITEGYLSALIITVTHNKQTLAS